MPPAVAAFTDTYLPTVNGVTYTVTTWRERWRQRGGRMDVVYPGADGHEPADGEHPVPSVSFPFYDGFRLGAPTIPDPVRNVDLVHAHTPFAVGLAGRRLAGEVPLVASYHTPAAEYAQYVAVGDRSARAVRSAARRYESWFLGAADVVLTPSHATREHVRADLGVEGDVEVLPNGVDVERFRPVDTTAFEREHGLDGPGPVVGYTGRHGFEKRLQDLIEAAPGLDATVVLAGDGPARESLEARAADLDADVHFLGFLDREDLPAFYAALDVFAFPSPVETQGLVALEAMACGTPVVGANSGALADTVDEGETGFHFEVGDVAGIRWAVSRALDEHDRLRDNCLARRGEISVERAVDRLATVYADALDGV